MGGRRSTHVDARTAGPLGRDGRAGPLVVIAVAGAAGCGTIDHTTSRRPAAVVFIELTHRQTRRRRLVASDARHDRASNGKTQRNAEPHAGADTHADTHADTDADSHSDTESVTNTNSNSNSNANADSNANPDASTNPNAHTGAPDVQPRLRHRDGGRGVDQHHRE